MHLPWVEPLGRFLFVYPLTNSEFLRENFMVHCTYREAPPRPPPMGCLSYPFVYHPLPGFALGICFGMPWVVLL